MYLLTLYSYSLILDENATERLNISKKIINHKDKFIMKLTVGETEKESWWWVVYQIIYTDSIEIGNT